MLTPYKFRLSDEELEQIGAASTEAEALQILESLAAKRGVVPGTVGVGSEPGYCYGIADVYQPRPDEV